ncbi:hypothetical protein BD626DRAFT_573650 [Schizophyllum amplum]|uniref:Uncharacterized protein n=1 Tax=Schizophyllum amplum TaxID=97359 RepID=A0A550C0V6_9AGAR|nr:hypothetical protein BD626DRAFT_573650 [Auriculariopsis ampla]
MSKVQPKVAGAVMATPLAVDLPNAPDITLCEEYERFVLAAEKSEVAVDAVLDFELYR